MDSTVSFKETSNFHDTPSDQESLLEELIPFSEKDKNLGALAVSTYSCTECDRTFQNKVSLALHMRIHSKKNSENPFHCKECDRTFKFRAGLGAHMRKHTNKTLNNTSDPAQSKWDDKTAEQELNLPSERNGQLTYETEHPFKCPICEKSYKLRSHLGNHMRSHSKTPSVNLKTVKHWLDSDTEVSGGELQSPEEKSFPCKVCGKSFKYKGNLTNHMYTHTEKSADDKASVENESTVGPMENHDTSLEKPFQCTVCDRRFMYKAGLVIHMRSLACKTPEKPKKSKLVDYPETDVSDGDLENSRAETPFQCLECDKTFKYKGRFLTHMRVHEEKLLESREKQMKLTIYYDAEASQFKSKSHEGNKETPTNDQSPEKPFHCTVCGKSFIYKARYTSHMESHEETTPENVQKEISSKRPRDSDDEASDESETTTPKSKRIMENTFECKTCHKVLKTRETLKNHMVTHSDERPFKCEICGAGFKLNCTLHMHKTIHKNICKCTECDETFNSKTDFHKHRRETCENGSLLLCDF